MADFIQGSFESKSNQILVSGNKSGYKYIWKNKSENINQVNILPVLIMDYSASMVSSNSINPVRESLINICDKLFKKPNLIISDIILIFFGTTAHQITCNKSNYNSEINKLTDNYNNNQTEHLFSRNGTDPTTAFELLTKLNPDPNYIIYSIFMTDGAFNGKTEYQYESSWSNISKNLYSKKNKTIINTIGYQNDSVKNIKTMVNLFGKNNIPVVYTTIKSPNQISQTMVNYLEDLDSLIIPQFKFLDNIIFNLGEPIYSESKLFDILSPNYDLDTRSKSYGVPESYLLDLILFEIQIGLYEAKLSENISQIQKSENPTEKYKKLIQDLVPYFSKIQKKYLKYKNKFKSIKSRNIPEFKSLYSAIDNLSSLFRSAQNLISAELDEKKQFEIQTKLTGLISSRHQRSLQRRRIQNELNQQEIILNITIKTPDPLTLAYNSEIKIINSKLSDLNNYYSCFYSQDSWEDLLNTIFGIPIQYSWKENDDYAASRTYIELISTSNFISESGYSEIQNLFGKLDHDKLYGDTKYLKSAHDCVNSYIPVATDPYFISKFDLIKSRLGHMMAGSNLGFVNRHILFYVAVIKQAFNQLLDNNHEKLRHIIILLLNSFRILTDHKSCIFTKDGVALSKSEIIYNIAIGNTVPYLFASGFESVIYLITANKSDLDIANGKYNTNNNILAQQDFIKLLWRMVFRHLVIYISETKNTWENPATWNIPDEATIKIKLLSEGTQALPKYLLSDKSVLNIPDIIQSEISQTLDSKLIKLFKKFMEFNNYFSDNFWSDFNKNYLPVLTEKYISEIKPVIYISEPEFRDIIYWSHWEFLVFGNKEIYPLRDHFEISKSVANIINHKYSKDLTDILADIQEYQIFKSRQYETRYLPIPFAESEINKLNILFDKIFCKNISEPDFKNNIRELLGAYTCKQLDETLTKDNLDILKNLYGFCQLNSNKILLKSDSKLPYSCPSHATSPYFLQVLSEKKFLEYYHPLGLGWANKKYRDWVNDLHPYMVTKIRLLNNIEEFVQDILNHIKNFNLDYSSRVSEIREFYIKFKN